VIFQIEKDLSTAILYQVDDLGTALGKELFADFKHTDLAAELFNPVTSIVKVVDIKGKDQFISSSLSVYQ